MNISVNAKVAWVPKEADNYLTESGVKSVGGFICSDGLTESQAQSEEFCLTKQTRGTAGKYIVVLQD